VDRGRRASSRSRSRGTSGGEPSVTVSSYAACVCIRRARYIIDTLALPCSTRRYNWKSEMMPKKRSSNSDHFVRSMLLLRLLKAVNQICPLPEHAAFFSLQPQMTRITTIWQRCPPAYASYRPPIADTVPACFNRRTPQFLVVSASSSWDSERYVTHTAASPLLRKTLVVSRTDQTNRDDKSSVSWIRDTCRDPGVVPVSLRCTCCCSTRTTDPLPELPASSYWSACSSCRHRNPRRRASRRPHQSASHPTQTAPPFPPVSP
jgi:hypothetical protein